MKKIFTLFLIMFSSLLIGQNRINDVLPLISNTINGQLLNAKGWKKNSYGEWLGRTNKIVKDLGKDQKLLENFESESLGEDNFISFEMRDVKIKDSVYSLLIKKYKDGHYRYESINEGWIPYNSYSFFVFSKKELEKVKNIKKDTTYQIDMKLIANDKVSWVDLKKLTNTQISKEINQKLKSDYHFTDFKEVNYLYLQLYISNDKKIVRFKFNDDYQYSETNEYYEVDYLTFNKFLKIE